MTPELGTPAVVYCRVSTLGQGQKGLGLDSQETRCRGKCVERGWQVVEVVHETISGDRDKRPLFQEACARARELGAVLVVAEASRLTRQRGGVLPLYELAAKEGWAIYALDMPEIDPLSPMGEAVLTIIGAINRLERRLTGQRVSHALKEKASRGEPVGRPRTLSDETLELVRLLRGGGLSLQATADELNARGISGAHGGVWSKQRVRETLLRYGAAA